MRRPPEAPVTDARPLMTLAQVAARSTSPTHVRAVTSPGGVEAWHVESEIVPLIALAFTFEGGAAHDPADKPGVAHMMARLLDEGAGPYSSDAFQERLAADAIELSFNAGPDALGGSLNTLVRHADEAFELLRLALAEPRFDDDAIERVRAQTIAGLRYQANDPGTMASKRFFAEAFPHHPYGRPTAGTIESVEAITRDDLVTLHRAIVAQGRVKVAVVGAIDAERLAGLLAQPHPRRRRLHVTPVPGSAREARACLFGRHVPRQLSGDRHDLGLHG